MIFKVATAYDGPRYEFSSCRWLLRKFFLAYIFLIRQEIAGKYTGGTNVTGDLSFIALSSLQAIINVRCRTFELTLAIQRTDAPGMLKLRP